MINKEFDADSGISPEVFNTGREVMWSFSPDSNSDKEPDYQLGDKGLEELSRQLEDKSNPSENTIFSAEEKRLGLKKEDKPNPWEPFTQKLLPTLKLLNFYAGPGEDMLELHRANTERFIEIAGIDGKVFLKDAVLEKGRYQVNKVPYGWQIEIDGEKIQRKSEGEDEKKPVDEQFAIEFEKSLRKALTRIMIKENLGFEFKGIDAYVATFALPLLVSAGVSLSDGIENGSTALQHLTIANYIALHITSRIFRKPLGIEGSRVIRGNLFINHKGRNLVRLGGEINPSS